MKGLQEAINNWNEFYNTSKAFFHGCNNTFKFIENCFTEERFLINKIKFVAPEVILVVLGILIILRILGFKNTNKWIGLVFVIALIISVL